MFKWLKQLRKKKPINLLQVVQQHDKNRTLSDEDKILLEKRKKEFEEAERTKSGVSVLIEEDINKISVSIEED